MKKNNLVDYNVVSETAGHQKNIGVELKEAATDIFNKVKEKSMQCAFNGDFIQFASITELEEKLNSAVQKGYNITIYDENIGG